MSILSGMSIERKLPLSVGALIILVVGTLSWRAYTQLLDTTRLAARDRLTNIARGLVEGIDGSYGATQAEFRRRATDPGVIAFLREPSDASRAAALRAMQFTGAQSATVRAVELWDRQGTRLLVHGDSMTAPDLEATRAMILAAVTRDSVVIGKVSKAGERVKTAIWTAAGDSAHGGFIVAWRVLNAPANRNAGLLRLIGDSAALYIGNSDGSLWTDFVDPVEGPRIDPALVTELQEYRRADGERRLALSFMLKAAPYALAVDVSERLVDAPARAFLRRELLITGAFLLACLLGVWFVSRRITRPLLALTRTATEMSRDGDASPVEHVLGDEIQHLIAAFGEMERRVHDARAGLERRVEERTVELHTAKEAADQANRAKSDFLTRMTHELRTPLNSIIGFSEVLRDGSFGALNEKQQRFVTNVLASGRQLLELINGILDLSKVESGRMELHRTEVALETVLREVVSVVEVLARQKSLQLELDVAPTAGRLTVDVVKLKQIMYNLLSNAIKFTPDGGRVGVAVREASRGTAAHAAAECVEIRVEDSGVGIAAEDQQRVFGEFEQVASEYSRNLSGTGLGLALTKRLVELHGGEITLESAPGRGSLFSVILPRGAPVAPERSSGAVHAMIVPAPVPDDSYAEPTPRILVVEDDPQSSDLLAHHLHEAGYDVVRARSAEEAIALARTIRPAAITLDIVLGERDGHVVLAKLKSLPETRAIPVIVITISADDDLGLSLGAAEWLVKPASREDLLAALGRHVAPSQ